MPDLVIFLALVVLAGMFALVEVFRTRGQDPVAWGVLALSLALIVDRL